MAFLVFCEIFKEHRLCNGSGRPGCPIYRLAVKADKGNPPPGRKNAPGKERGRVRAGKNAQNVSSSIGSRGTSSSGRTV